MSRILLITDIFPPHIGGPATFIDQLGHALARQGHSVTVICSSDQPTEPSDAQRPFRVRRIYSSHGFIYNELKARLVMGQEMRRHKTILVNGLEYLASQVAGWLGRQYILKIVGDAVWESARNMGVTELSIDEFQSAPVTDARLQKVARRRDQYLRQARFVITPSNYLQRIVVGWGVDRNQVRVVLNGVRLDEYASFEPLPRSTEFLEVAFCGRLTNWKGVETLLLALKELSNVRVSIIGDGPAFPMLLGLAQQLQIMEKVRFLGRLQRQPLQKALSQANVLVLTSLYEGLSHTLLEASAMGLACIASECGGNPEVIEPNVNGLLIPYGDVAQLKSALESLHSNEDLRYQLAKGAKANSKRFDFKTTVQQTADLLCGPDN